MKEIIKILKSLKQKENQEAPKPQIPPESSTVWEEMMFLVGAVVQASPKQAITLPQGAPQGGGTSWGRAHNAMISHFEILHKQLQK